MCGRFDQSQTARYYASVLGWADAVYDSQAEPAWNVSPGTYRPVMHMHHGERRVDDVFWSYRARWAEGKVPICINARLEKLGNRYWARLLEHGRGVVAAEGWYEWTGEKGRKQPWHIHDRKPLVVEARDAELWLDPALSPEQALQLARASALPSDAFDWFKVSPAVNRAENNGPELILPLEDTPEQS